MIWIECIRRKKRQALRAPRHREIIGGTGSAALRTEYMAREMPVDRIDFTAGAIIKLYGFIAM